MTSAGTRTLLCAAALYAVPSGAQTSSAQAVRAADFLNTMGVATHTNYTDGRYADIAGTISDLHYLGIHQVRDAIPDPNGGIPNLQYLQALGQLQADGDSIDFVAGCAQGAESLAVQIQQIDSIAQAKPGSVLAVEGSNEVNNWPCSYGGVTDPNGFVSDTAADRYQADLYAAVKGDSNLRGVPVYFYTGNVPMSFRPNADYATTHPYPYRGDQPYNRIAGEFAGNFTDTGSYPKVITEMGYFNEPDNPAGSGVDDATQAKGTLNLYLDAFLQGITKTFVYQLRAAYPDPNRSDSNNEYGLFNLDNTPKPAATAVHNLTTLLGDTGTSAGTFNPGSLSYSLSGMPASGHSLILQKSDGTFVLALWAEPVFWNEATHSPIAASANTVTVQFGSVVSSVAVADPLQGTGNTQTYTNTGTATVSISDHPVLLSINAGSATTTNGGGGVSPTAWYQLVNQSSGACLDDFGWNTSNGAVIGQWTCGGGKNNQEWQFRPADNGYYSLVSRNAPGSVVDVKNQSSANGSVINLWPTNGQANQQWMPVSLGNGLYKLVGRQSGRCLDVPGASTTNGVQLQVYDCNGTGAQAFQLVAQP